MPLANSPEGIAVTKQNELLQLLLALPLADAIGAACSFLLHCAYNHRVEFRRVMNEKVVHEGFSGISLLQLFNRVSR